ncbi:MAG: HAMP domain-containing sensor histidine kinase [Bacilli bacterium]|nr:HAMP domain-containing sensor histidine kinase [Bacilli bacterium]MDD3304533.1 HAMP domain-containing sensor histidine kinase [Bacilli bacterium]MDD4053913.1 HAMP domain-containing sensor histidine kinase [Bacilli bacterium]MDD4411282.1 HAMP domain-containing sensor histidine kinase [Bacilli bacterium]
MTLIESFFVNSIFILFPLYCYFLFVTTENNLTKRVSDILFDLALFTSLYIISKFDIPYDQVKVMFITIPLLIAYLKDKKITAIILSLCIAFEYIVYFDIALHFTLIELLIYPLAVMLLKIKEKSEFTIISTFVIIKSIFNFIQLSESSIDYVKILEGFFVFPFAFYFTTHIICYLMKTSEKTMNLHMTIKELEHQKQLRDSLFKISHEIKNPIAVCKGYLDMFEIGNCSHAERYIPIIKQELDRTLTLLNDFMMLTKVNVELKKMDVSVLLQDTCDMLYFMLKQNKIDFICSVIDEEVYILGDYDRLKQVFVNIMKNAVEAIPKDRKGKVKFEVKTTLKKLVITVVDNGIGIKKHELSKMGEPFYTTKKNGTGLGVKFSKEIIKAHEGTIEYKSKLNIGTMVIIKLPLKKSL